MSSQHVVPGPPAWYDFEGKRFHRDGEGYYWSGDGGRLHIPDGMPMAPPAVPASGLPTPEMLADERLGSCRAGRPGCIELGEYLPFYQGYVCARCVEADRKDVLAGHLPAWWPGSKASQDRAVEPPAGVEPANSMRPGTVAGDREPAGDVLTG